MQKLIVLILLFSLLSTLSVTAQNSEKIYKRGIEAFYKENFEDAIFYFEKLHSESKPVKDSRYRLEIAYLVLPRYRERSLSRMIDFEEFKGKSDKFYYYWMGRIYANRYMFPEAVAAWQRFLRKKEFKSEEIIAETKSYLAKAELLTSYFDNPDNYEIHRLEAPINSEFTEITPVYSEAKKELIFASNRSNGDEDEFTIYHSTQNKSDWSSPTALNVFGTLSRDLANVEVVNEGGRLFVFQDKHKGSLFYTEPNDAGWSPLVEFDSKISSSNLGSHFYINEHEDRIIFSTRNKDSGLDLMESFKSAETGKWEDPHPLATSVNSEFDEDSPFLTPDEKTLYFLSNRPNGVGGYDVYVSTYDDTSQSWSEPQNMGWPINSPDDEIHFKMNADGKSGYFSSNRIHSKGDYDIFFFWQIGKIKIQGRVLDAVTQKPIRKGQIRFHPILYLDEYFRAAIDSSGQYNTEIIANESFKVEVINYTDTLMVENTTINAKLGSSTISRDFYVIPKELPQAERLALEAKYKSSSHTEEPELAFATDSIASTTNQITSAGPKQTPVQEAEGNTEVKAYKPTATVTKISPAPTTDKRRIIGNIYFEHGASTITETALSHLQATYEYLNANPAIEIIICGHADSSGAESMNKTLSQKRAEVAKQWLVNQGIPSARISAVGYGSSSPLASNDDEINGRDLNRRIEIRLKN